MDARSAAIQREAVRRGWVTWLEDQGRPGKNINWPGITEALTHLRGTQQRVDSIGTTVGKGSACCRDVVDPSARTRDAGLSEPRSPCQNVSNLNTPQAEDFMTEMPYMPSVVNVGSILEKMKGAGTPPKFTHDFLKATLGFSSSNDRAMIKVLRSLNFISADSAPTQRYNDFKGAQGGKALADGLREGWADLFMADQKINEKSVSQVQAVVKSVTGAGDAVAQKTASTFKALSDKADWAAVGSTFTPPAADTAFAQEAEANAATAGGGNGVGGVGELSASGLFRLHHDIHIHLPPSSDVAVYRAIFQALKAELM